MPPQQRRPYYGIIKGIIVVNNQLKNALSHGGEVCPQMLMEKTQRRLVEDVQIHHGRFHRLLSLHLRFLKTKNCSQKITKSDSLSAFFVCDFLFPISWSELRTPTTRGLIFVVAAFTSEKTQIPPAFCKETRKKGRKSGNLVIHMGFAGLMLGNSKRNILPNSGF